MLRRVVSDQSSALVAGSSRFRCATCVGSTGGAGGAGCSVSEGSGVHAESTHFAHGYPTATTTTAARRHKPMSLKRCWRCWLEGCRFFDLPRCFVLLCCFASLLLRLSRLPALSRTGPSMPRCLLRRPPPSLASSVSESELGNLRARPLGASRTRIIFDQSIGRCQCLSRSNRLHGACRCGGGALRALLQQQCT